MHKGIVHDSGSNQGMAEEEAIARMYVFPHWWENITNRLGKMDPIHSITFVNPRLDGVGYQYQKGEVFKIKHKNKNKVKFDKVIKDRKHLTPGEVEDFIEGRMIEVRKYKDETDTRIPTFIHLIIGAILLFVVMWLTLKMFGDFPR